MSYKSLLLVLFAAVSFAAGCSCERPLPKVDVTGTITLDGQPMADGDVIFKTSGTGTIETLKVTGGQFAGKAEIGKRMVEVYSYKTVQMEPGSPGYDPAGMKVNMIPEKYNARTDLTAEVTKGGENKFKFDVTSM